MILPTMTPEEKVRQMEKMKPLLNEAEYTNGTDPIV